MLVPLNDHQCFYKKIIVNDVPIAFSDNPFFIYISDTDEIKALFNAFYKRWNKGIIFYKSLILVKYPGHTLTYFTDSRFI